MLKHTILVAAVAGLVLAMAPAAQAGTILVGDPLIPDGLEEGAIFHLVFVTSTTTDAVSADIDFYNAFVNTAAELEGSLVKAKGWTWSVIGSTAAMDAIDNTGTNFTDTEPGSPIYLLTGELIANHYKDLWDATIHRALSITQFATNSNGERVWTGTKNDGTAGALYPLGADETLNGITTEPNPPSGHWITSQISASTDSHRLYASSDPLLIIPEPATLALLGLGGLGLILGRKRR